jgi:hypothetical protein
VIDRLISGAGALTDLGDRIVRALLSGGATQGLVRARPSPVPLAALAAVIAVVLTATGFEANDNPTAVTFKPADLASSSDIGRRTYASMDGRVVFAWVETYADKNDNGKKDADETGQEWFYFLVGDDGRSGVTVRSARPPEEVFRFEGRGTLVSDSAFVGEDAEIFRDTIRTEGLALEPTVYVDTWTPPAGAPADFDWSRPAVPGNTVSIRGAAMDILSYCTEDRNGNGACDDDEIDAWDLLVADPASRKAMIVAVAASVELWDAAFTGMLREDPTAIKEAKTVDGYDFASLGLNISDRYLLDDGRAPASAPAAFIGAAIAAAIAGLLLIGLVGGYLVYRRSPTGLPGSPRTSMRVGDRIPLRVTGKLMSPAGLVHVREAAGELARVPVAPPSATEGIEPPAEVDAEVTAGEAPGDDPFAREDPFARDDAPPSTVIVERPGKSQGLALGRGELTRISAGRVVPFRGPKPALRVMAGTGALLLSFGSEADRDRAAAELMAESRLSRGSDGVAR